MKILFLTENFPPETNAAATRVYERACYWVAAGHRVTVITCAPNFPDGRLYAGYRNRWHQVETMSGIRVVRVKTFISENKGVIRRTLDFTSFMATSFAAGLCAPRPDVVVATSPQFFAAVGGWALAATRRLPFVFELGDLWPASIAAVGALRNNPILGFVERLELFLYRRAAAVVALTPAFKADLVARGIAADKIAVVINGVDLARYAPRARDAALAAEWGVAGCFTVGYVGTHGMAHALEKVLLAAQHLRGVKRLRFLFVGAGATRDRLIGEARRLGLDNTVFIAAQPKDRMPAVWSLCDVALIHLKDAAAFAAVIPSKIFEAMAMGRPLLIAAPPGEATRLIADENAGINVAPEDPAALADAVRRLMADAPLRRALGLRAREAAPRYSRRRQADTMLAVLEAAAQGQGAAAADHALRADTAGAGRAWT
jgi:putative colanic acid biosynthesis glycosyltransferase WcaI